jgi:3-hydroxyisobutyrate dehydrogenase-like beta-hydroxyacid dehydrogenase
MGSLVSVVGFIGVGAMGGAMAARLLGAGHQFLVHNRTAERAEPLLAKGALWRATAPELALDSDVVLSCLSDTKAVEAVFLAPGGLVDTAREGQVFVEHGTFSADLARTVAARLRTRGSDFLDVPVTGGPPGAAAGTLVAMAGGSETALEQVAGILSAYCRSVVHVGDSGSGLELKLVNQLLVSSHMAAAGEAVALLQRIGIEQDLARSVLTGGWADSAMLGRSFDQVAADLLEQTGVTVDGMVAVQALVADLVDRSGVDAPVFAVSRASFDLAASLGAGQKDPAVLASLALSDVNGAPRR